MKVKFELKDEITITNTTVKIVAWITGVINDRDRQTLEGEALGISKELFPDAKWAFSDFTYNPDGFTFRVQATTRIDSSQNDNLEDRAASLGGRGRLTIQIYHTDHSIPLFQRRAAESDLRVSVINKAVEEATKLRGRLTKVQFLEAREDGQGVLRAASATYSTGPAGGAAGSLGHSEKIFLKAILTVDTSAKTQLNG